jgi:hypothetical protein
MMNYQKCVDQLYFWKTGKDASNFHSLLYHLISKADPENRARLRIGFRDEVQAFEDWQASPNEDEFFKAFGISV